MSKIRLDRELAISILNLFDVDEEKYNNESIFLESNNKILPSVFDITYSILKRIVDETTDYWKLKNLYGQLASLFDLTDKDPSEFICKSNEYKLKSFLELGIYPKVKINCLIGDCKAGKKLHNKKMKTEDALKLMIIPSKDCTHKYGGKYPFCVCDYIPLAKGEK